jgi:hypothetical protein
MKGTTVKPQVDVGDIGKQIASGLVKQQVGDLIPGVTGGKGGEKSNDPLGGLLDQLGGKKKEPEPAPPDQPTTPPPSKKKKK